MGSEAVTESFALMGKCVLVTGASSGLGAHFAEVLGRAGAEVMLTARREAALAERVEALRGQGIRAWSAVMDVSDDDSVSRGWQSLLDAAGRAPDVVVNNAGMTSTSAAIDIDPEEWSRVLDTNLTGALRVSQHAARVMREQGGGAIVNVASILGLRVAGQVAAYSASKAGLIQLTRSLALEWARDGIRVNALAPGYIETPLNRDFFASEAGQRMIKRIPQRRLGTPESLNGPLLLLCSEAGSYMTGSVLSIDGGHLINTL